jgi:hypothetical protein
MPFEISQTDLRQLPLLRRVNRLERPPGLVAGPCFDFHEHDAAPRRRRIDRYQVDFTETIPLPAFDDLQSLPFQELRRRKLAASA